VRSSIVYRDNRSARHKHFYSWHALSVVTCRPSEREETERVIRSALKEIMMSVDLDEVTSKFIRGRLEETLDMDLGEYKPFIDQEMLTVLGQMDAATRIFPHVYLGSEWNASNLDELSRNGYNIQAAIVLIKTIYAIIWYAMISNHLNDKYASYILVYLGIFLFPVACWNTDLFGYKVFKGHAFRYSNHNFKNNRSEPNSKV